MQLKKIIGYFTLLIAVLFTFPLKAQITIGAQKEPHPFSVMELSTDKLKGGLRMPQLTTHQRDSIKDILLGDADLAAAADGLAIYNMDTNCLEFWEETRWVSLCTNIVAAPIGVTVTPENSEVDLLTKVDLKATVDPTSGTLAQYKWERSSNGSDWTVVSGETGSTLSVVPDFVGVSYYKATAYNEVGSATSNVAQITATLPIGAGTDPNIQLYVGAFWKSIEKGERLIQFNVGTGLNNSGAWTASVAWYDDQWDYNNTENPDGVVLANSAPANLSLVGADAESFPVTGGSRSISGSVAEGGTLSFRVGLDKTFGNYDADNNPARYAVVILTYNDGKKWQKFFIRQGEGADYVMKQGDSGAGVPAGRPAAIKFSPYNLTDPRGLTPPSNYNSAVALPVKGGDFVNYPTKAGYFFIFSGTKAFDPDVMAASAGGGGIGAWGQTVGYSSTNNGNYWDPNWETCPGAYRRPTDGANNTTTFGSGAIAGSEIRQSLWENPPALNNNVSYSASFNSTWGYYADGYFDRKPLMGATSVSFTSLTTNMTIPASAVAFGTIDVAYEGRLFFNPTTNASLFFPAGGYRTPNSGVLTGAGYRARYWTSSSSNLGSKVNYEAWFMYIFSYTDATITKLNYDEEGGTIYFTDASRSAGGMVRCVKQ